MKSKYCLVRFRASRRHFIHSILATALAFASSIKPAQAQTNGTWDGGGTSSIWGGINNWSPDGQIATGAGATATFGTTFTSGTNIQVNTNRTIGNINHNSATTNITISQTNSSVFTLDVTSGSPTVTVGTSTRTLTITAPISGNDGLTKAGAGTLILSGTNLYTGTSIISAGDLVLGANAPSGAVGALGNSATEVLLGAAGGNNSAGILINGAFTVGRIIRIPTSDTTDAGTRVLTIGGTNTSGTSTFSGNIFLGTNNQAGRGVTLTAANGGTTTFSGVIQNPDPMDPTAYTVTKSGAGTVTLSGSNTFTGTITIGAGTLSLSNSLALQNSTLDTASSIAGTASAGLRTTVTSLTLGGLAGNQNFADLFTSASGGYSSLVSLTLNPGTGVSNTYGGAIGIGSGSLALTKSGAGLQILNGALTHSGGITVSGGVLTLGRSSNTYTGETTIAGGGRGIIVTADGALGGIGTGNGTTVTGAGTGNGGALGLSGGITYSTLEKVTGSGAGHTAGTLPGFASSNRGFIQSVSGNNTFAGPIELGAEGISRIGTQDGASLTLSGAITQATGVTTANILFRVGGLGGDFVTLANSGSSFGGDSTVFTNSSTGYAGLRLGIDNALPTNLTVSGFSGTNATNTAFDLAGYNQTLNGLITNATLNVINLNTVTASTLTLNPTANRASSNTLILGGGGLGVINLVKNGAFSQILSGANTYTGTTSINDGFLQLDGAAAGVLTTSSVSLGATGALGFTSGSATILDLTGKPLTLGGGTLVFDIGAPGTNDSITVNDFTLTANSNCSIRPIAALNPTASYTVLTSANPINTNGFGISAVAIGKLTLTPTINANTITITPVLSEGTWNQTGGGDWSIGNPGGPSAPNWDNYKPSVAGDAALFGAAITTPSTINVDSPQSIGYLRFDNSNAYTIGNGASSNLTLDNGVSAAIVTVTSGSHTIAENVSLASDLVISPAIGATLSVSGNLTGARSVVKSDAGTAVLSGITNSYTGTTSVVAGTLSLTGSLTGGAAITVTGTGVLDQSSTGIISGASSITHSGSGISTLAGANTYTGVTTVSNGTLILSGSRTTQATGGFTVGNVSGSTGTLNVTDGTFTVGTTGSNFIVGTGVGSIGVMNQSGGNLTTIGNQLLIGSGTATGTYNLSNGTLTTIAGSLGVTVGTNTGATANFNLSGSGTLTMPATSTLQICRSDNSAASGVTGTFNQTGGTATIGILRMGGGGGVNNANANAELNLTGGVFAATTFSTLSVGNDSNSTINIGGNADVTLPAFPTARGTNSTATVNFDGGTLRPAAASTAYMGGLTNAFIKAGGVTFHTSFDISVSQALLTDAVSTGGGLTKDGFNMLTLTGANTFTGATVINGGTLQLNGTAASSPSTSGISINSGGSLGFTTATASSLDLTGKPLTLNGGSVAFDLGTTGVNDSLTVGNFALTANSTVSLRAIGAINTSGSYTLLTSTNPIATGGFALTAAPIGRLSGNVTVNSNTVTITPTLDEGVWNQTGGGNWSEGDPNTTAGNWTNYKPSVAGDAALFGSAITGPSAVIVDTPHVVGYLRFHNSNAYTIGVNGSSNLTLNNGTSPAIVAVTSGSHTIAENVALVSDVIVSPSTGTTLTMSGNLSGSRALQVMDGGKLVLTGANTYSGATSVSAGTLQVSGAGTLGGASTYTGAISLGSGAVLQFSNNTAELTYTLSGQISGQGSINKDDGRRTTLTLSGANNSFSGGITISTGRVTVASAAPLGTGTITCIGDASEGGQLFISGTPTITNNLVISGVGFPDTTTDPDTGRGGAIRASNGQTFSGSITLAGNARIGYIGSGALSSTYSGKITGTFGIDFYGGLTANSSTQTFVLANTGAASDYSGNTRIICLDFNGIRTGGRTVLQLGATEQIPNGSGKGTLIFNGANADHQTILELNGFHETLNGISNAAATGAIIRNNPAASLPATLTVGDANSTGSFSGVISDGGVGKELSLVKTGTDTLTLSGANTFNGNITVDGGTLIGAGATNSPGVTVFGTRANTRTITVNNGGTLQLNSGNILGTNHISITAPTLIVNSGGVVTNGSTASNNALNNVELNGGTLTSTTGHVGSTSGIPVYGAWNLNGTVTSTGISTISTSDPTKGWIMLKVVGDKTTDFTVTSGTLTVSAPVVDNPTDGNIGAVNKSGPGAMVFSGANTYTGNTTVSDGSLELADNAQLKFVLGASSGSNNSITGTGAATLNGDFVIDTSAADSLATGSWTLENVTTLTGAYGSTFTVVGFTDAGNNKWTKINGAKIYTFDETTGVLTLAPNASYATWAAVNAIDSLPGQDKDGDGVSNAIEYVLGGSVTTNDLDKLPTFDASGANLVLTFRRNRESIDGATTVQIEVGTTLNTWPGLFNVGTSTANSSAGVTVAESTPTGFDTITLTVPKGTDTTKFGRLKVTVP